MVNKSYDDIVKSINDIVKKNLGKFDRWGNRIYSIPTSPPIKTPTNKPTTKPAKTPTPTKPQISEERVIKLATYQNNAMQRRFSTMRSQYTYKTGQLAYLSQFIFYLVLTYYLFSAVYIWILCFGPNAAKFTVYYKVIVALVIVVFPYVAAPVEMFLLRTGTYVIETTVGKVYERPDYEYIIDYNSVPNLFSY
jgi:hypothetical protein